MPTVCIQCAMRALLAGEPPPAFEETPEAHLARVHPDLDATRRERRTLEAALAPRRRACDNCGLAPCRCCTTCGATSAGCTCGAYQNPHEE